MTRANKNLACASIIFIAVLSFVSTVIYSTTYSIGHYAGLLVNEEPWFVTFALFCDALVLSIAGIYLAFSSLNRLSLEESLSSPIKIAYFIASVAAATILIGTISCIIVF